MYKTAKRMVLLLSKYAGLFWVSRRITRKGLRILCYHNFSKGDACQWKSKLFIHPDNLAKRLDYLDKHRFRVLSLEEATQRLSSKPLSKLSVVITIDDGWQRTLEHAHPLFKEKQYPYTVYASTYYSKKEMPVLNLVLQYMFWRTKIKVSPSQLKRLGIDCSDKDETDELVRKIQNYAEFKLDKASRYELLKKLGGILDVDFSAIDDSRRFHMLTSREIQHMVSDGVDFQLHSHRHRWPLDQEKANKEIGDNRSFLQPLVKKNPNHFCYPSGFWRPEQFKFLKKAGIQSAVTCEAGFNYPDTNFYRLYRFLDGENISQLEFEAEMSGFLEMLRRIRKFFIAPKDS